MNRILPYYQKELLFLKHHIKLFASRYPKIANRLRMVDGESEDPHVDRIIESFALLTSRIHQRLDDDMPEVTEALLTSVAPQFLRTMPSTCIVSIEANRQISGITDKNVISAGTSLFSRNITDVVCQFQTVYPVTLLPISVNYCRLRFCEDDLYWHLSLDLQVWSGAAIADESLRLFLHGPSNVVNILYTLLCSELNQLTLQQGDERYAMNTTAVCAAGFKPQDSLVTQDPRVAPIHVQLLEYFFFPQKFHFIDVRLPESFRAGSNSIFRLEAVFNRTHLGPQLEEIVEIINKDFFRLHCTPAINLFAQRGEPITLSESKAEYPVIPDIRSPKDISVWTINHVHLQHKEGNEILTIPIQPLLGIDHSHVPDSVGMFWQSFLRENLTSVGTEKNLFIAFSSRSGVHVEPSADLITLSLICTNNNIPNTMKNGHTDGDFDSDVPIHGLKICALNRPTRSISPPDKSEMRWRLISQLSLNHMLLSSSQGVQVLRETLMLYNFSDLPTITRMINMIIGLQVKPVTARLIKNDPLTFARGVCITLTFSHEALNESEYYPMCCFLDRYLGLYSPVNSFTRLVTLVECEDYTRRTWPIRAGKLSWI